MRLTRLARRKLGPAHTVFRNHGRYILTGPDHWMGTDLGATVAQATESINERNVTGGSAAWVLVLARSKVPMNLS